MDPYKFITKTLHDPRVFRILAASIDAVEPGVLVRNSLHHIPKTTGRIFALGLGKAAQPMTETLAEFLPVSEALIITKHAHSISLKRNAAFQPIILEGGHPIPDERSLAAGQAALEFAAHCGENDLLVCLLSGGGSALAASPADGISLVDLQSITSSLLASGASIREINALRRSLDKLKGGGLAKATDARVICLIISDVLGNPLESIASGPTIPNPTTNQDVLRILSNYDITPPDSILRHLQSEDIRGHPVGLERVENHIIGDINTAAHVALIQAKEEGFDTQLLELHLQGEARQVGRLMANHLKTAFNRNKRPFCLLAGGETTVTIHGDGKGGRNQELALSAVDVLDGLSDVLFIAFATDGDDGPTDAAGAVVNGSTRKRAEKLGLFSPDFLSRNDSYRYFDTLGDLLKPGSTATNVNDLIFMFGL